MSLGRTRDSEVSERGRNPRDVLSNSGVVEGTGDLKAEACMLLLAGVTGHTTHDRYPYL